MAPVARGLMAFVAWGIATAVLGPVCFFVTVLLAGPHSSMLPSVVQPAVLLLGWVVFLVAPLGAARLVWRRLRRE
jgi:hypothetical protein